MEECWRWNKAAVGDFHVRVPLRLSLVDVVEEPEHIEAFVEGGDGLDQARVHRGRDVGVLLASLGDRGGDAAGLLRVRADVALGGGGSREEGGDVEGADGGHVGSGVGGGEVCGGVLAMEQNALLAPTWHAFRSFVIVS